MRGTEALEFAVTSTQLRHGQGVYDVVRLANGYPTDRYVHCINPDAVAEQLERFPEGQFVAITYEDGVEKVIGMATTLHTIAAGNMTPTYRVTPEGQIRELFFYTVDTTEFAVNKLGDRGSLGAKGIVTNVQDFVTSLCKSLEL